RRRGRVELHERPRDLAEELVRHPDDAAIDDRGMLDQRVLDLGRIDVHSGRKDQVRAPIAEEQEPFLVQPADVADRYEIAAPAGGRLGRRAVVVESVAGMRLDVDGALAARRQLSSVLVEY